MTMENINKNDQTFIKPKLQKKPSKCKVCGRPANYFYFGARSCATCKAFFRRNAENKWLTLRCKFDGNCDTSFLRRRMCPVCRLKKCFQVGMSPSLFRKSYSKKKKSNNNQIVQLPTLNFLRPDQSRLSKGEWNLLFNVVRRYDERSTILIGERFVHEQNSLPIKLRFKFGSINKMLLSLTNQSQLCLQSNLDFLTLNSHDQTVLINSTLKHVLSIGTAFAFSRCQLLDHPTFLKAIQTIFPSSLLDITKRLVNQIDRNDTFMKLIISIIIFSTTNYIYNENAIPINLINLKQILNIQNTYIELAWKYLIYKYDDYQAIKRFSNIIRVIFISIESIHHAKEVVIYSDIIDFLTKQTERAFNIQQNGKSDS